MEAKQHPSERYCVGEENVEIIVRGDDSQSVLLEVLGAPATSGKST